MKLTIDQAVLDKYDLTIGEFMLLYLGASSININKCMESILAKGLADKNLFENGEIVVSDNIKELIELNSNKKKKFYKKKI